MLGKQALEKFITEANIAKQALNQYGSTLRTERTLDFERDVLKAKQEQIDQQRSDARRAGLMEMLGGGLSMLGGNLFGPEEKLADPRTEMLNELLFRKYTGDYLKGEMGGLHPNHGVNAALKATQRVTPQMGLPGSNTKIPAVYQVEPPTVPTLKKPQASTYQEIVDQINALGSVGRPTQKK